jgi:hypothetical protein
MDNAAREFSFAQLRLGISNFHVFKLLKSVPDGVEFGDKCISNKQKGAV